MSVEIALSNEVNEERRLTPLTNKGPSKLKGPSNVNVPDDEETNRELPCTNILVGERVTKRIKKDSSRVSGRKRQIEPSDNIAGLLSRGR